MTQFDHALRKGDEVAIRTDRYAVPKTVLSFGMKVHFEDADIIVIDKPSGLLSIASDSEKEKTAYYQLTDYVRGGSNRSKERVWIVHRLDRDTSGLMVYAKNFESKEDVAGKLGSIREVLRGRGRGTDARDGGNLRLSSRRVTSASSIQHTRN